MGTKRLLWLDNLKGFLIILVVLGHCIQNTTDMYQSDVLFRYIYSFHMPLFMFVSGFACYKERIEWASVSKRFVQLIIPFLVWTGINALIKLDPSLILEDILRPEKGLWFLWALFFITIIHTACCRLAYRTRCKDEYLSLFVAFALFATMRKFDLFCYSTIAKFFIYYILGFYSRKYIRSANINIEKCSIIGLSSLVVFLVLGFFSTQSGAPSFMPSASSALYGQVYNLVVSLIAITSMLLLFRLYLDKYLTISKLGEVTLGVYAIHRPIMSLLPLQLISYEHRTLYYVLVLLLCCIVTVLSYYAVQFINRNRYTSLLLNGLRQK